jgi:hypothetical protein
MKFRSSYVIATLAAVLALNLGVRFTETDQPAIEKIVRHGENGSELMSNIEYMTDMIGPRLTGSKQYKLAADWVAQRMRSYGLKNVNLESFFFGRGWRRGAAYGRMIAPYEMQLHFQSFAWTPGTDGKRVGPAIIFDAPNLEELRKLKDRLRGAFILWGEPGRLEIDTKPRLSRMSNTEFREEETAWPGQPRPTVPTSPEREAEAKSMQKRFEFEMEAARLFQQEGVAAILVDSRREHGLLEARDFPPGRDPNAREAALPSVVMAHEHYGMLYRLCKRGIEVRIEMDVKNHFDDDGLDSYNVVGDMPGATPDEMVILGAHLDSWDLGAGATDNAAGAMVVLESARILLTAGLKPRRTIKFILFGGEEQGLLGSRAYVWKHKDELAKISGMFALDTGTGRIRGIGTQGNKALVPIFAQVLAPVRHLGVLYVNERTQLGSDHLSFEEVGVPGFAFFQDSIDYKRTHHSQTDTLDKIMPEDLKQAATVMAVVAYSVAELPQLLPRKAHP